VNAGICWAHAILIRLDVITNPEDFAKIGAISFALTAVNIVCIWVSGMVMFAIKVRICVLIDVTSWCLLIIPDMLFFWGMV
jgi:hypothetical protein